MSADSRTYAWAIKGPGEGGVSEKHKSKLMLSSERSISKRQFSLAARRGQVFKQLVMQQLFRADSKDRCPRGRAKEQGPGINCWVLLEAIIP